MACLTRGVLRMNNSTILQRAYGELTETKAKAATVATDANLMVRESLQDSWNDAGTRYRTAAAEDRRLW